MIEQLPVMLETRVQSLGRENPLEKEMATHSSILAWEIPWTEEPGGLHSMGSQRVKHDWVTNTHTNHIQCIHHSVQFSCSVMSDSLRPHELQHTRSPCPSPTPGVYSNSCPSSQWCHPTISCSVVPFSSCFSLSQHQGLFKWVSSLHQVAKVLEFQLQHQSFQRLLRTDFL